MNTEPIKNLGVGDKVQLTYCDYDTIYEIDKVLTRDFQKTFHLKDLQGWKAEVNLMAV